MSHLKEIRERKESVKNTSAITQAMKMVATARLKKAQERILLLRPYAQKLLSVMADVALTCNIRHPLLMQQKSYKKTLLVVLTSDRGLCGGFNNNICKYAYNFYHTHKNASALEFFFIGKKAKNYFLFRGIKPEHALTGLDRNISYDLAKKVSQTLITHFTNGDYDSIYFIYNSFQSVIVQKVVQEQFLPIDLSLSKINKQSVFSKDLIFETKPKLLLEDLIKKHFTIQVYRCMCESVAAEYGARMSAMDSATKNAKEIIAKLTIEFNKLRQGLITTELIEVSSGAEAMK